jgi:hypothetical protein
MLRKYSAGVLLLVCTLASAQSSAPVDRWIAVRAGRLFDGTEKLAPNQVILIKGDRIVKVGPAEQVLANAQKDLLVGFTTLRDLKTLGAMLQRRGPVQCD